MTTPVHEYTATKQDFLDAQRLHRKNRRQAALGYYLWLVALPILCCAFVLYTAVVWITRGDQAAAPLIPFAGASLYLAFAFWIARWFQMRRLWNQAQPKKYRGLPVTVQFDEQQIVGARPGASEGRFFWTAIEDFAEDEKLALVYLTPKLFLFLPKRAMDQSEWERLRTLALPRKIAK